MLTLSPSRRSSVKRPSRVHGKYFRIPNGLEGRRVDTTGLSGWMVRRVRTTPTGRRNKILLKLIRALGCVCKESRRRRRQRRGRRDSPPKVDRSVWARYFNEFWYFDTFPTSCYALPRALSLLFRYIYYTVCFFSILGSSLVWKVWRKYTGIFCLVKVIERF